MIVIGLVVIGLVGYYVYFLLRNSDMDPTPDDEE